MLEMIPKPYRGNVSSERKVYSYLEDCDISGFAIHSVRFESPRQHEADFIIITKRGILALEVKGGNVTWSAQEGWMTTNRYNEREACKDPYDQVFHNITSLLEKLKKDLPSINVDNILWSYGVVLPDTYDLPNAVRFVKEITFAGLDDSKEVQKFINRCFDYSLKKVDTKWHPGSFAILNDDMICKLKEYLCGQAGILRDLKRDIEATESHIIVATEEQYRVLGILSEADRLLIRGGAGTGKTLLALEHARRLSAKGLRVLFLTYNKLLKQYLKKECGTEGVDFINFDKFIYDSLHKGESQEDSKAAWEEMGSDESQLEWNRARPDLFIRQGGLSGSERYDAVIVDEAQDVLSLTRRLKCIDLIVKGGLAKGRVCFFYDASQHLFQTGEPDELDESIDMLKNTYGFFSVPLNRNCRNTVQIAEFARLATGLGDAPDETAINSDSSVEVKYYSNQEGKMEKLTEIFHELKTKGIAGDDILLLSHRKKGNPNSSLTLVEGLSSGYRICEMDPDKEYEYEAGEVKMSNIYRYKGLQEKVVIVTDVDDLESGNDKAQKENYACFTRAKAKLYVVAHEGLRSRLEQMAKSAK